MAVVVTQSQDAAVQARLASLAAVAGASQAASAHVLGTVALAGLLGAMASQQTHGAAALGKLAAAIRVQALNVNTAAIVATLPRLVSVADVMASQDAVGVGKFGALTSEIEVQATNVNTARIVASLPRLRGTGATAAVGAASAQSRLLLVSDGTQAASQAAQAKAALPNLWTAFRLTAEAAGTLQATLGALVSTGRVQPPPAGYPVNDNYCVALPARPFIASLPARSFYVLDKP